MTAAEFIQKNADILTGVMKDAEMVSMCKPLPQNDARCNYHFL